MTKLVVPAVDAATKDVLRAPSYTKAVVVQSVGSAVQRELPQVFGEPEGQEVFQHIFKSGEYPGRQYG
jgi:hypothetical protein